MDVESASDSDSDPQPIEVLMFPWLDLGNTFSYLELAKKLSLEGSFNIHFYSPQAVIDKVKNSFNPSDFSIEFVELKLPEAYKDVDMLSIQSQELMGPFQDSRSAFQQVFEDIAPDLLIYDEFQPWAAKIVAERGVPSVLFATSSSISLSYLHHVHTFKAYGNSSVHSDIQLHHDQVEDLLGREIKVKDAGEGFQFGVFNLSSEIVLIKSCSKGIEGKYMEYLSALSHRRILPLGPLVTVTNPEYEIDAETSGWLDMQGPRSTLYVSFFGMEISLDTITEVARALETLEVSFVWAFPITRDVKKDLPEGFLDGLGNRGIVVTRWVPQAKILAHKSIGGFLSHCGWYSVLESLYVGVPVIGLPLEYDQPWNCRLMSLSGVCEEVLRAEDEDYEYEAIAGAVNRLFQLEPEETKISVENLSHTMKTEEERAFDEAVEELKKIYTKSEEAKIEEARRVLKQALKPSSKGSDEK